MKSFNGKALFLDRANINTDEIIPAKYLTEIEKEALKEHLLEDLVLPDSKPVRDLQDVSVVVARENFGCGSSREHAPWALEVNGINLVIAPSFARIFRQNMFNCGMIALELAAEVVDSLFRDFAAAGCTVDLSLQKNEITFETGNKRKTLPFTLAEFDRKLVEAGGWVDFADSRY